MIIVDASVALSWYLEDEATSATDDVFKKVCDEGGFAPSFWPLEIANVLQMAVRTGKISRPFRDGALNEFAALPVEVDPDTQSRLRSILRLSDRYALTAYDSAYVELAQRRKVPLAMLDRAMAAAARAEGVPVLP